MNFIIQWTRKSVGVENKRALISIHVVPWPVVGGAVARLMVQCVVQIKFIVVLMERLVMTKERGVFNLV